MKDTKRQQTMLKRVGDAADLIDNLCYLPFYRSIQIKLEKSRHADEWAKMIATAKTKDNPKHYFATLCKMVKNDTYKFCQKIIKIAENTKKYITSKLSKFNFGEYEQYWVNKSNEFIAKNGMSGFIDLLEYADNKKISQKYLATAIKNCKSPRQYYQENILNKA